MSISKSKSETFDDDYLHREPLFAAPAVLILTVNYFRDPIKLSLLDIETLSGFK